MGIPMVELLAKMKKYYVGLVFAKDVKFEIRILNVVALMIK